VSLEKFRSPLLMRLAALALLPWIGWPLGARFRLLRDWDDYFSKQIAYNDEFKPTLEDGTEGKLVMKIAWVRRLASWIVMLHAFVDLDGLEPSHTHQADFGIRIILFGGYDEEVLREDGSVERLEWRKGDVGVIPAAFDHRMVAIRPEGATSLWVRGPTRNPVRWTWPSGAFKVLLPDEMD